LHRLEKLVLCVVDVGELVDKFVARVRDRHVSPSVFISVS
jgi:hypothetical protein